MCSPFAEERWTSPVSAAIFPAAARSSRLRKVSISSRAKITRCQPFTGEMFGAPVHRVTDLDPETAASRHSRLAREKLAIQPRRTRRADLLLKGGVEAADLLKPPLATGREKKKSRRST